MLSAILQPLLFTNRAPVFLSHRDKQVNEFRQLGNVFTDGKVDTDVETKIQKTNSVSLSAVTSIKAPQKLCMCVGVCVHILYAHVEMVSQMLYVQP